MLRVIFVIMNCCFVPLALGVKNNERLSPMITIRKKHSKVIKFQKPVPFTSFEFKQEVPSINTHTVVYAICFYSYVLQANSRWETLQRGVRSVSGLLKAIATLKKLAKSRSHHSNLQSGVLRRNSAAMLEISKRKAKRLTTLELVDTSDARGVPLTFDEFVVLRELARKNENSAHPKGCPTGVFLLDHRFFTNINRVDDRVSRVCTCDTCD